MTDPIGTPLRLFDGGKEVDTKFVRPEDIPPNLRDPAVASDGTVTERSILEARIDQSPPIPTCSDMSQIGHDARQCLGCQRRIRWVQERLDEEEEQETQTMRVSGDFLFDLPSIAPLWGTSDELLAAEGQGWMIVGPDGTGKTSTAIQYVKARLGLSEWDGQMWGLPVQPLPPDQSVFYMAMDRPRQMMEAFKRGITEEHRSALARRLHILRGPPPYRLSRDAGQRWLLNQVEDINAGMVVLDSRKDLGSTVEPTEVAGVSRAIQLLVSADIEVLVLAHPVKGRRNGAPTLEDVSGLRDVFSGLGSVVFLDGAPGKHDVEVHHVKPIREVVAPFRIVHDHATGRSERVGTITVVSDEERERRAEEFEKTVLDTIECHKSKEAPSSSIKSVLESRRFGTGNLSRDLKRLVEQGLIESNGKRGAQAGYRRPASDSLE